MEGKAPFFQDVAFMSARSLPIISVWPSPMDADMTSPDIRARHANDQPCFNPVRKDGRAAGKMTRRYKGKEERPIVFATLT